VPAAWPPDLYDRAAMEFARNYLREDPDAVPWTFWYVLLREPGAPVHTAIGICGFKGGPTPDGTVEIGYSVLNDYQRRGYASEAVAALVDIAFGQDEVRRVVAETLPDLLPSRRVLEKNGFRAAGTGQGSEPDAIRYVRERA
jgi:ribosomal-protein-alanine N-acetyltransferase